MRTMGRKLYCVWQASQLSCVRMCVTGRGVELTREPLRVTTHAGAGSAFEYALKMAVLAGQVAVESAELVAGCQMVKLRPLNRFGVGRQ